MMNQFKRVYWPGGMTLDRSAWWLCEERYDAQGVYLIRLRIVEGK